MPPIAASAIASTVVGTCTTRTPRIQVAAQKPARSPTTPPPSATTAPVRSIPASANRAQTCSHPATDFVPSPFTREALLLVLSGISWYTTPGGAAIRAPLFSFRQ